jgi:hypothetical protein
LDDHSGNIASLVYSSDQSSLANVATVRQLTVGSNYAISVTAVNEIGESVASESLNYSAGIAPSKIEVLSWEASSTTSVTVKWELPEFNGGLPLTHFSVYYDIG